MKKIFMEWIALILSVTFIHSSVITINANASETAVINEISALTQDTSLSELNGAIYYDYANELTKYRSNMFKSFSKVYVENSTGLEEDTAVYKVNQGVAVGTTELEKVRSLDGAYVLYKNESFDLTGFSIWMYQSEYNENLLCNVYISDDGEKFRLLDRKYGEYEVNVNYISSDELYEIVFYSDYLKEGIKYLKIEFSKNCSTLAEVAATQLGMAAIACADNNELPSSPIEFENNIYTDNCNSAIDDEYVKYTNIRCEGTTAETSVKYRQRTKKLGRAGAYPDSCITYKCPDSNGEITDVAIWLGRHDAENINIKVSISEDGEIFEEVGIIEPKNITIYPPVISPQDTTGGWVCSMGSMTYLPHGAKYMRLNFPETYTNWWGINLLKVQFGYDSAALRKPQTAITTYEAPQGAGLSAAYTAKVRKLGDDEWSELDVYSTKLREKRFIAGDGSTCRDSSFAYFDFEGAVEVAVTKNSEEAGEFSISPDALGIECRQEENTAYFVLTKPVKLMVEADGDKYDVLHLFANPIEKDKPDLTADNVIYFPPGYYDYQNTGGILKAYDTDTDYPYAELPVSSDKIVYIAGGAVVNAHITITNAENVIVCGRGILSESYMNTDDGKHVWPWQHWGIRIVKSTDVTVKDIILNNADWYSIYGGESSGIGIYNLKALSNMEWSDGIDMMSCSNVTIDDCFLRNADDCIAIYADRLGHTGNAENWKITNNILVADIARGINVGGHGSMNSQERRTVQNIYCENNCIISNRSAATVDYAGAISVKVGDENILKNVTFKNFIIEGLERESPFSVRVMANVAYGGVPGFSAQNILFENIYSDRRGELPAQIYGWNETGGMVSGVAIKNLHIDGELQRSFEQANVQFYSNIEDIYLIAVNDDSKNLSITYDVKNPVNKEPMFIAAERTGDLLTKLELAELDEKEALHCGNLEKVKRPFEFYIFDKKNLSPFSDKQLFE